MKPRCLVLCTGKFHCKILEKLSSRVDVVLHFGRRNSDYNMSDVSRVVLNLDSSSSLFTKKFFGSLSINNVEEFLSNKQQFFDHLERRRKHNHLGFHGISNLHEYQDYYHILTDSIDFHLREYNVNCVVFFDIPHLIWDSATYYVAKARGLSCYFLRQSWFDEKFIILRKPSYDNYWEPNNLNSKLKYEIEPQKKLWYMPEISGNKPKKRFWSLGPIDILHLFIYAFRVDRALLRSPIKFYLLLKRMWRIAGNFPAWRKPFRNIFDIKLLEYFEHIVRYDADEPDYHIEYVYFPLHLQPEMTTSTLGGIYNDQALALEHLRAILPDHVHIFVKENPKQGHFQRGHLFFKRLGRISGLVIVPSWVDTYKLLDNCRLVATVTGTIGFESIQKRKPAIIFGSTWYQSLHGVFKYSKALDYDTMRDYQIDLKLLSCQIANLKSSFYDGVISRHIAKMQKIDEEENARLVTTVLAEAIISENEFRK